MTRDISLLPQHEAVLRKLVDFAARDPEGFRLNAARVYAEFSSQDRLNTRTFETEEITAYCALDKWQTSLRPLLDELENNRTKPSFYRAIVKYLLLDSQQAARKIEGFIQTRRHEVLSQFVVNLYPKPVDGGKDKLAKQRSHAYKLLAQSPQEIEALRQRYTDYLLHHRAAQLQSITVTDPHAPWIKRKHASKKVTIERKKTTMREQARLQAINEELEKLASLYNGLLGKILERNWDLIVVIGLRNRYEKKIQTLSEDEAKSPLKRLEIFEKITKEFRDEQVEKLARNDPTQNSLAAARSFAEIIDGLLLQIFDLTNAQKNQLLTLTKEARELTEERANIIKDRTHRQQILQMPPL